MFVSRLLAFAVTAVASVSFVGAAPAAAAENDVLVKRDTPSTVLSVLSGLNTDLGVPIGQINTAVANNDVSFATIQGPCNNILTLIVGATANLQGLPIGLWDGQGTMPPVYNDCVNTLVLIIMALIPCLGQLLNFPGLFPQIVLLLFQIDVALCALLTIIKLLLLNVVAVVGGLCISIKGILQALAFILTLACLGY